MRVFVYSMLMICLGGFLLASGGCKADVDATAEKASGGGHEGHDHDAHPTEGPHHGGLIELGNEEYHAELVHDEDAGVVTIYILDASAKSAVPIEATALTVNLSLDGQPAQFELPAAPEADDPSGKSSKFASDDTQLAEALDREDAAANVVVTIAGKQYRGAIEHDHGHDDAHEHEE